MPRRALACAMLALVAVPCRAAAEDACLACRPGAASRNERPLTVEITSNLEFSRMALAGQAADASAEIDPQTGSRRVSAGLIPLGGITVQGHGRITGTPLRPVRIDFPPMVTMTTPGGGNAVLRNLATNLPPFPVLDANGVLEFAFGGELQVRNGGGGNFRARIPIEVDYN